MWRSGNWASKWVRDNENEINKDCDTKQTVYLGVIIEGDAFSESHPVMQV